MSQSHAIPEIFRAERATSSLLAGKPQYPRATVRLPSNVPYVVDNLWEFLRPAHMPSRRHSIYASPTRELAKANCSAGPRDLGLCVYALHIEGDFRLAQLTVKDAREHPDRLAVMRFVQEKIVTIQNASAADKSALGLLCLPGASRDEWIRARDASSLAEDFIKRGTRASTFWKDASGRPNGSNGELFFELSPDASYKPVAIARY